MRTSTRNIVSAVGLGTLALSYVVGMNSTAATSFSSANLVDQSGSDASATNTATNPSASPTAAAAASSASPTSVSPSAAPSVSSTKKSSGSTSTSSSGNSGNSGNSSSSAAGAASKTKEGSIVDYRYGSIQLSVTKVGSKISKIDLLVATASDGREAAFSPLVQAAIGAQGSGFGNLTDATFTTDAFKQALDSALSKF